MVDRFTRWPEAVPIAYVTAATLAKTFFFTWVARFGYSNKVTTDQGCQFESALFRQLSDLCGITKLRTTAFHPSNNGLVERSHHPFKAAMIAYNNIRWTDTLPAVLLGLRSALKEDIGASAAELVYDTSLRLPGVFLSISSTVVDPATLVGRLWIILRELQPTPMSAHTAHGCVRASRSCHVLPCVCAQ